MIAISDPFIAKELQSAAKNQFFKAKARFTRLLSQSLWGVNHALAQICNKDVTDFVDNRDDELEFNGLAGIEDVTLFVFSRIRFRFQVEYLFKSLPPGQLAREPENLAGFLPTTILSTIRSEDNRKGPCGSYL